MNEGDKFLHEILPILDEEQGETIKKVLHTEKKSLPQYVMLTLKWNFYISYKSYYVLFNQLIDLSESQMSWTEEIRTLTNKFMDKYKNEKVGEVNLETYQKHLEDELLNLSPILIEEELEDPKTDTDLISKFDTIRDEVKKGNHVNFKLLQEIQLHIDEKLGQQELEQESSMEEVHQQVNQYVDLLLEVFDLLDLIKINAEQKQDSSWLEEVSKVVDKAIHLLEEYGIEEVPVIGEPFDGSIMEGIGTVSLEEVEASNLQKYEVYSVFQRGFRYQHNQSLIRRAKVITIY
ncbi:nucleotide exchange factor GrpE [Gracilibacillus massiliensis]|uniref:nucleotide exchange factor GrpE n=1 Tax=Gracilibacillus massiliensis TaxID=1564956 RepID=UPI00071CF066|nr:nucleotide exchange factor GrpE [Gracilibacillus massiliensis]